MRVVACFSRRCKCAGGEEGGMREAAWIGSQCCKRRKRRAVVREPGIRAGHPEVMIAGKLHALAINELTQVLWQRWRAKFPRWGTEPQRVRATGLGANCQIWSKVPQNAPQELVSEPGATQVIRSALRKHIGTTREADRGSRSTMWSRIPRRQGRSSMSPFLSLDKECVEVPHT